MYVTRNNRKTTADFVCQRSFLTMRDRDFPILFYVVGVGWLVGRSV